MAHTIFEPTGCCALYHLRTNGTSVEDIRKVLLQKKKEEATNSTARTTCFVIAIPGEEALVQNLLTLGFKEIAQFRGKRTYGDRILRMFIMDFADVQEKIKEPLVSVPQPNRTGRLHLKNNGLPDRRFKVNQ